MALISQVGIRTLAVPFQDTTPYRCATVLDSHQTFPNVAAAPRQCSLTKHNMLL